MKLVAISDLHGHLPHVEPCDVLIIAGDICPDRFGGTWPDPDGQRRWLRDTFEPWLSTLPAARVVTTWGNHDFAGVGDRSGKFVVDRAVEIDGMTIWCSPWSNTFGGWAWMKPPSALAAIYEAIPNGVDIIVSHQPPYGYGDKLPSQYLIGDRADEDAHAGSRELLATIDRVKPRAVICGHIHDGFGRYEHNGIPIYNVSVVNEQYKLVNGATEIELAAEQ